MTINKLTNNIHFVCRKYPGLIKPVLQNMNVYKMCKDKRC